ncbi:MAG: hypothetical protein Kow0069_22430 [Promethearchaeota archaeon]
MTMDSSQKKCCGFCIGLLVLGVIWFTAIYWPWNDLHAYKNNDGVSMSVLGVNASIVVWPNGQASVTQVFHFRMEPTWDYELHGIWWETQPADQPGEESHLVKPGSASATLRLLDTSQTKELSVHVGEGGRKVFVNGIGLTGNWYEDNYEFLLETTYTTKNSLCRVDPADNQTKFAFIPPVFSQSNQYTAEYYYDVIFASAPLQPENYTTPDYGVTQQAADALGFRVVSGTISPDNWEWVGSGPRAEAIAGAKDLEGKPVDPNARFFAVNLHRHMARTDYDKYISFKFNSTLFDVPPELLSNAPADYWSLEEMALVFWLAGLGALGALVAASGVMARGLSKAKKSLQQRARERARRRWEKREIARLAAELEAQGYVVPEESRKSYTFLRALSETIYTDEYKELLARGEIRKVDLLVDHDADGDVDEDDLAYIIGKKLREIYERDIMEELEKAGMVED